MKPYIFTVWIWPAEGSGKQPRRTVMRVDGPNPESVRYNVCASLATLYGTDAVVEFGPFGIRKLQS